MPYSYTHHIAILTKVYKIVIIRRSGWSLFYELSIPLLNWKLCVNFIRLKNDWPLALNNVSKVYIEHICYSCDKTWLTALPFQVNEKLFVSSSKANIGLLCRWSWQHLSSYQISNAIQLCNILGFIWNSTAFLWYQNRTLFIHSGTNYFEHQKKEGDICYWFYRLRL